jgi:hypothetical protein
MLPSPKTTASPVIDGIKIAVEMATTIKTTEITESHEMSRRMISSLFILLSYHNYFV